MHRKMQVLLFQIRGSVSKEQTHRTSQNHPCSEQFCPQREELCPTLCPRPNSCLLWPDLLDLLAAKGSNQGLIVHHIEASRGHQFGQAKVCHSSGSLRSQPRETLHISQLPTPLTSNFQTRSECRSLDPTSWTWAVSRYCPVAEPKKCPCWTWKNTLCTDLSTKCWTSNQIVAIRTKNVQFLFTCLNSLLCRVYGCTVDLRRGCFQVLCSVRTKCYLVQKPHLHCLGYSWLFTTFTTSTAVLRHTVIAFLLVIKAHNHIWVVSEFWGFPRICSLKALGTIQYLVYLTFVQKFMASGWKPVTSTIPKIWVAKSVVVWWQTHEQS